MSAEIVPPPMPGLSTAESAVIEAAVTWVERIHDHPNLWGDSDDFALITAVKALTGATYSWETS